MKNGNDTLTYTYDAVGNITRVFDGTYTTRYEYDNLNQLIREDNQKMGSTYVFTYDHGNITSKKEYSYTMEASLEGKLPVLERSFTYDDGQWKDLLTNWDGVDMSYDEIGNLTKMSQGGIEQTFTWDGRQLTGIHVDGYMDSAYEYNDDRLRTKKTVTIDGVTSMTEFFYNRDQSATGKK